MLLSQRKGLSFNVKQPIVSKRSSEEKPMDEQQTEKYEDWNETMVRYTRTVPVMSGSEMVWFDVRVYLSKDYLTHTPAEVIKTYLDRAVAAVLTRNGCTNE